MLSTLDIDGGALRHNYRLFARLVGQERMAPVLKANAYGHGLPEVLQALAPERPPYLCVNYISEGAALRRLGYRGRILIVGPLVARELARAEADDLEPTLGNFEVLRAWAAREKPCRIHVKFDTGMSRQGFLPSEAGAVLAGLLPRRDRVAGISTHFANVEDVTEHAYADRQLAEFADVQRLFAGAGFDVLRHAASSASALLLESSHFDLARIGIALYGVWPSALTRVSYLQIHRELADLRPALAWHTEVTTVKAVKAGQFIGYGCTYRALRDMRIAVVPVGYYEGYPRIAGDNPSYVLIGGQRCPLAGRICMNMLMVDTSHLPAVAVGDRVTLIGTDGAETIAAHDVAGWAKTIHYEIFTRLHPEIPRRLTANDGAGIGGALSGGRGQR